MTGLAGDAIRVFPLAARDPLQSPLFSQELAQRYLIFDACVDGERRVDLHPLVLGESLHRSAIETATAAARLIGAVADRALSDEAEAEHYRFAGDVRRLAAASASAGDRASLCRVDLLLGEDGFRACEINADCPGGHNEALGLPRLAQAAGFWSGLNPTTVVQDLATALIDLARGEGAIALLYATAYAEDLQVCALLQRELTRRGARALLTSPTAPQYKGGRLRVGDEPIAVLYRYFPTEFMEGQRNLGDIARAVAAGAVRTLASFSEIFAQSKLAFARAHTLADTLAPAERAALRFLPRTCALPDLTDEQLLAEQQHWVLKRALGRVGEEVFVGPLLVPADWARALALARADYDSGEVWVAQSFVPQRAVQSPYGPLLVTLGVYLLNGRFCGYFARLTPDSHASHSALCLPVFVEPAAALPAYADKESP